jgi:hypothetical protein
VGHQCGSDEHRLPGRQIALAKRGTLIADRPTRPARARIPSLDVAGTRVAFESMGDLAGTNNPRHEAGVPPLARRRHVTQVSSGIGSSTDPCSRRRNTSITYQSTSHPQTGLDTGVSQIWVGGIVATQLPAPITAGHVGQHEPVVRR